MSAAAAALAVKAQRRVVVVRLADASNAVTALSLIFGAMLVLFPEAFPRMIVNSWQRGQLMPILMVTTFLLDTTIYLRIAYLQSARPGPVAAACLGSLPLLVVGGLSLLQQGAVSHTLAGDLPNLQARISEEILAHTYLGLVGGVFLPFLVIRLVRQFRTKNS